MVPKIDCEYHGCEGKVYILCTLQPHEIEIVGF